MNNIFSTNAFELFCFVLTSLPVYISLALNYFQKKRISSDKAKIIAIGGNFQEKFLYRGNSPKRLRPLTYTKKARDMGKNNEAQCS